MTKTIEVKFNDSNGKWQVLLVSDSAIQLLDGFEDRFEANNEANHYGKMFQCNVTIAQGARKL